MQLCANYTRTKKYISATNGTASGEVRRLWRQAAGLGGAICDVLQRATAAAAYAPPSLPASSYNKLPPISESPAWLPAAGLLNGAHARAVVALI